MIKNRNIPLIILGITAVLLAAGVVRPLFLSIKQNSETLIAQKETLAVLEKTSENLKRFQSTYDIYQDNFKKIDQLFVDKEEPVGFIEFLEKEAGLSNLTIDLTPVNLKNEEGDFWPSTSFRVDMTGSFPYFLEFLDKVESSPYLVTLSGFSLNKPSKATNGEIIIAFQMKIYTK